MQGVIIVEFASVKELVITMGTQYRGRIFLSSPEDGVDLTYDAYLLAVRRLEKALLALGMRKGERVALLLANGLNYAVTFTGVMASGGVVVPINPHLKPAEVNRLLVDAGTSLVVTDDGWYRVFYPLLKGLPVRRLDLGVQGGRLLALELASGSKGDDRAVEASPPGRNDLALLLYTSGTTGKPKGVMLTHGNLLAEARYIQKGHRLTPEDTALCILPLYHINGEVVTLITPIFSGGRVVMPHKFRASRFWDWVRNYRVTWFSAVPTILSILLSHPLPDRSALSSLRFARSASAPLPVAVLREFEARFAVPVIEAYGLSETASQVTTNPLPPAVRKPGSVGLPVGNQVRVVNENGETVPAGVTGEVVVRGENVCRGYFHNEEATAASFKGGWFYTGDLGYLDADGYLFLTGRRKELINRGGEKFSPREIDEILYRLPEVELAAAVGVPDPLYGEEVVAFIQLRPGKSLAEDRVISFLRDYLADFKVPREVIFIRDFPRGPSGKIQRLKLVDLYLKKFQGAAHGAGAGTRPINGEEVAKR